MSDIHWIKSSSRVQDQWGSSQPVDRRRTRRRDDDENPRHDEFGPSQPPIRMYQWHREAEEEAGPSEKQTQPKFQVAPARARGRS